MYREQFEGMSIDELWDLHSFVGAILSARLVAKKDELERRLGLLLRQNELQDRPENRITEH